MKKETFSINGEELVNKIKELIKEGNVRKVTITDKAGKELLSIPLLLGVAGVIIAPVLAGLGAMAVLIGECNIVVEREEDLPNNDSTIL
ncbi:DUF4342 domain-containing protein [Mucilaginibacter limnophilus]|uniref:DUF4342 domain-containing protein n=1 Tax=Mucilaginibacter limnophilus TaxID=1932778 RepID=A0A3S2ULJ9_9SPHI|nr:DUF4342 domain-containing protein [Mucilaginibacter limnophilus]RVT96505.1 DUF4342 domain-containing protein [Mucilaginibacter limnophilus]